MKWETALRPRRLRLPSLAWRFATVFTLVCLMGSDPNFERWWTARASCEFPTNPNLFLSDTVRETNFSYDVEGRLAQVVCPEGEINYSYDLTTGRHTRTCTANSEVGYGYDDLGRLQTATVYRRNNQTLTVPETTTYTYTAVGSRSTVTLPNQTVTTYLYDSLNRLTNMTHVASNNVLLASYSYQLHVTGRRTNAVEVLLNPDDSSQVTNAITWQYDGLYRLTNEVCTSSGTGLSVTNGYVYDAAGNRVKKVSGNVTITSTFNANDQLLAEINSGGTASTNFYAYDENGSVVARTNATGSGSTVTTYAYNVANKLKEVAEDGVPKASFQYNDAGIRVRRADQYGATKYYLIDANNHTGYAQVLEEKDYGPAYAPTMTYVLGDDVLGQCSGTGEPRWLLYDGHGSTRQLTGGVADVVSQYHFDSYGRSLTDISSADTSLLYCGEQYDSTLGMYNLRARYLNPDSGRFNGMDSFRGNNSDPQSLHKYLYAHGDPVNGIDPTGRFTLVELLVTTAIIGIVLALALPSLSKAKHKAKVVKFRSDVHSLIASRIQVQSEIDINNQGKQVNPVDVGGGQNGTSSTIAFHRPERQLDGMARVDGLSSLEVRWPAGASSQRA